MNTSSTVVSVLGPMHVHIGILSGAALYCSERVTMNVYLNISHGLLLYTRDILWKIPQKSIPCVILGRPVLQSIGCDNREMLEAFCHRHDGGIYVERRLMIVMRMKRERSYPYLGKLRCIARYALMTTAYRTISSLPSSERTLLRKLLRSSKKRIEKAEGEGLHPKMIPSPRQIVQERKEVFRVRLGNDAPALVSPLKIKAGET